MQVSQYPLTPNLAQASDFAPESKIWIYTADRDLSEQETEAMQSNLAAFCEKWTAHNQQLKARAEIYAGRYLILMVDETQAGASGCSIDSSVHFLEALGKQFQVDLFNRMQFGFVGDEGVQVVDRQQFQQLLNSGEVTEETLVVNSLAANKTQLAESWLTPFSQSWLKRLF